MKVCPKDSAHKEFVTVAVVCQNWVVDGEGNFLDLAEECTDIYFKPDSSNIWECAECGTEATNQK